MVNFLKILEQAMSKISLSKYKKQHISNKLNFVSLEFNGNSV